MNILDSIDYLEKNVPDPRVGLSRELFLLVSRLTPLVNVDLLVKDEAGRVLLSWRDDQYAGQGWHVPGGILRYKETLLERVDKVMRWRNLET